MKVTKSSINQIPVNLFIDSHSFFVEIICELINTCFSTGIFPQTLKLATVIPLFKSGETASLNNYRPISILPTLSKVFEKCLYNRLLAFVELNSVLTPCQFGFRRNISTVDAVLELTELQYTCLN